MKAHLLGSIFVPHNFPIELPSQVNAQPAGPWDYFLILIPIDLPGMIVTSAWDMPSCLAIWVMETHKPSSSSLIVVALIRVTSWRFLCWLIGIIPRKCQNHGSKKLFPPFYPIYQPNGRFETHRKICLSISGYHPESWRPSWSIRTALLAIIGFMPTHGAGAIGSLDLPSEERKILARK